ncbi:hypothetical protein V4841_05420 [Lelliottia amnigena]|uniref:Uncharacterized protein n=1 Tax=Lelliottia amnigena TaxID=61646 RepID=A0ABU7UAM0_LELAM
MNDEVFLRIKKAENNLQTFIVDPKGIDKNFLLASVLDDINDINIEPSLFSGSDYKRFRFSLLMLHLNVLQEFDKYYIQNYNPGKKYFLHLMPPSGAVEGPYFGPIDPTEIKDEKVRETYEKDLAENAKLGEEIALQGELLALKMKLSMYNNNLGVISDAVNFIKLNYNNSVVEQAEVEQTINSLFHGSERGKKILKSLYKIK